MGDGSKIRPGEVGAKLTKLLHRADTALRPVVNRALEQAAGRLPPADPGPARPDGLDAPRAAPPAKAPAALPDAWKALDVQSADDVRASAARLPALLEGLAATEAQHVLGRTPGEMEARFFIPAGEVADVTGSPLQAAHRLAPTLLRQVTSSVLKTSASLAKGAAGIDQQRLSAARTQHAGYVTGVLARNEALGLPKELVRALVGEYFEGRLRPTKGEAVEPRAFLASELAALSSDPEATKAFVLSAENDGLFSREQVETKGALLPNLAALEAGEAALEFAAALVGGEKAEAFVKHVFGRSESELGQLLRDPQGLEGALMHFAASAHHLAWASAKLASGADAANEGRDEAALAAWRHPNLGGTRELVATDAAAAVKVGDQIESYLLHTGRIVPLEREASTGLSLFDMVSHVRRNGYFAGDTLRVVSPLARGVAGGLKAEMHQAARLGDWTVGAKHASAVVAQVGAAFAAHATQADFAESDRQLSLFHHALQAFEPELQRLEAEGRLVPDDATYKALYSKWAGEFSLRSLRTHLGPAEAGAVVRNATLGHLIPQAIDSLRLPMRADFTHENLVEDLKELRGGLLAGDYYLQQDDFMAKLVEELAAPKEEVSRESLELATRVPNAVWMWLLLVRGLVENKLGRLEGGTADLSSDAFPDKVQFNPPDLRDIELFGWARHRLAGDYGEERATRMALAVVALTLYKDIHQLKGAQGG